MVTQYPNKIDNNITLPDAIDNITPVKADVVNRLKQAILAIENELGTKPSGVHSTLKARLAATETSINNLNIISLSGDLGGTLTSPDVVGLRGIPISDTVPATNQGLVFNGLVWAPANLSSGASGSISGEYVLAMADSNQTLPIVALDKSILKITGILTATRTLTFSAPATEADSYQKAIFNACTGESILASTGVGNSITIESGSRVILEITPSGILIADDNILDPRDFGCPWNGVDDDLPGLEALLASIPISRDRRTTIHLPKGMGYCSGNLHINRNVEIIGYGNGYNSEAAIHNGIKFSPLRGIIFDGHFVSSSYPNRNSDNSRLCNTSIISRQAIVTDAGGNIGQSNYFLDTSLDVWTQLPATVPLGSIVLKSGVIVGSTPDYYNEGASRNTTIMVMFRCTTSGTKGSSEPAAFATAGVGNIGTTISATSGTAVWTIESVPKDYINQTAYVVGQRIFVPGDTDHVFECEEAGTSAGWSTTIAVASNGLVLPQATIDVASTSTFPSAGTTRVFTSLGPEIITYTGITATTLTGCSGGTGTLTTGNAVTAPFNYPAWGVAARIPPGALTPPYLYKFYDRSTLITAPSNGVILPQAIINVTNTDDFASSGIVYVWTGIAYEAVTYTSKTSTTFDGCTGGTGTMSSGNPVGQGIKWKHITAGLVSILANWITIEDCSFFGGTGNAVWIQANADASVSHDYGYAGGSNFWSVRNCIFGWCGGGITTNSNNTNGGESCNIQHLFLGGGHTDVDAVNYLNITAGKFGNGSAAVKDRTQGNNKHRNHYLQFSGGMPFRNDIFAGATPSGNYSQWDYISAESTYSPVLLAPAVVVGAVHGIHASSTATNIDGAQSANIRTVSALVSNPAKHLRATIGPQNTGAVSCLSFNHSDDSYEMGLGMTNDLLYYPPDWFALGKSNGPGFFDQQLFLFPRPSPTAVTWPSGNPVSGMAMWVNQDNIWIGGAPNADPSSIGFGTAAPVSGFYAQGSVVLNKSAAVGAVNGWRCTVAGSPGTWVAMQNLGPIDYSALGTGSQSIGAQQFTSTVDAKGTIIDVQPKNVQTTDATVTTLDSFTIASNTTLIISAIITAVKSDNTQGASYIRTASFRNNAGTVAQISTTQDGGTFEDDATWDAAIDNSTTTIRIRVTGVAATTIRWTCVSSRIEVIA